MNSSANLLDIFLFTQKMYNIYIFIVDFFYATPSNPSDNIFGLLIIDFTLTLHMTAINYCFHLSDCTNLCNAQAIRNISLHLCRNSLRVDLILTKHFRILVATSFLFSNKEISVTMK